MNGLGVVFLVEIEYQPLSLNFLQKQCEAGYRTWIYSYYDDHLVI